MCSFPWHIMLEVRRICLMYEGNNPTALQSQKWLVESLFSLMEEKPFSKISVMDICRRADLSRQTFYNFFSDKEEILHFYLCGKYSAELDKYKGRKSVSIHEIVSSFLNVLMENEKILTYMLSNNLELLIAREIADCVDAFAKYFVKDVHNNHMLIYSEALLSGAIGNILVCWMKQKDRASEEELTSLLQDFFKGNLFDLEV